ncbi:WD repeat-containing protein 46 [Desmophyllum pertusum]|uniref:WD repeat-containing protein 46 n=1 Tax=Desmophyllum pertusum TaxID=174260 RepID=A0A9X0CND8_9CNID|nr:WD repeat-containing protein 46 [Desmophyllum pertusum]
MAAEAKGEKEIKKVKDEEPVDKAILQKYHRGSQNRFKNLKDKKLRGKLRSYESQYEQAAVQAAKSELLLTEEPGYLEAEGLEKTFKFKQRNIADVVDVASAKKYFDLKLDTFGPYRINYTRNGRFLLIGGKKGHLATIDWQNKKLGCEVHVQETVRDVRWLHIETMFAVAQKKCVYIYDNTGIELHCLKNHRQVNRLEFLPYHFLLASVGDYGILKYQDTSTGKPVCELFSKLGKCDCMTQNPYNAVIHLGHYNGTVTMWAPSMKDPLVKMLCHRGPVQAIAIDNKGYYMATSGLDGQMKIWDVRTYKQLQAYYTPTPASCLAISQRGLLAVGHGPHIQIWRDPFTQKQKSPYMSHLFPSCTVHGMQFSPFEDVLGVGHSQGFGSLLIPGAGEPNFDALEANPYQTKKQRQEFEVKALLEKIQPELITLNPMDIVHVNHPSKKGTRKDGQNDDDEESNSKEKFEPKHKTKGRSSSKKQHLRKKGHEQQEKKVSEIQSNCEAAMEDVDSLLSHPLGLGYFQDLIQV